MVISRETEESRVGGEWDMIHSSNIHHLWRRCLTRTVPEREGDVHTRLSVEKHTWIQQSLNKQMEKWLREERKREREGRLTDRVRGMDRWGEGVKEREGRYREGEREGERGCEREGREAERREHFVNDKQENRLMNGDHYRMLITNQQSKWKLAEI